MGTEAFLKFAFTDAAMAARAHFPPSVKFPHFSMLVEGDFVTLHDCPVELVVKKRIFAIDDSGQARICFVFDTLRQS